MLTARGGGASGTERRCTRRKRVLRLPGIPGRAVALSQNCLFEAKSESGPTGGDHVVDLHFPPLCAMLLTASEGEHHGTHFRAVSPLSQRPGDQRRQDQSWTTTL